MGKRSEECQKSVTYFLNDPLKLYRSQFGKNGTPDGYLRARVENPCDGDADRGGKMDREKMG